MLACARRTPDHETIPIQAGWLTGCRSQPSWPSAWRISRHRRRAAERSRGGGAGFPGRDDRPGPRDRDPAWRHPLRPAFVAASSPIGRLREPVDAENWQGAGAQAALLLFLRGHPEWCGWSCAARAKEALLHTGRRVGVPVLWVSTRPTGLEGAAVAPAGRGSPTTLALASTTADGPEKRGRAVTLLSARAGADGRAVPPPRRPGHASRA